LLLEQQRILLERGPKRVSPTFLPNMLTDSCSGHIAISLGLRGPNMAVVSACATGNHALGEAYETIRRGDAEAVIAGGADASILPLVFAGFTTMRALAQHDDPTQASRPFDRERSGSVISEGAGALAGSSAKAMTGHMMGASGAGEAVVCCLTLRDQVIAPTINLTNPDPDCDLDYVPHTARQAPVEVALSNSFGLGGHNASVILG